MRVAVVILAGGNGRRMGTDIPKQFLLLREKPVLMRTVEAFSEALPEAGLTVVLPPEHLELWSTLCREYNFRAAHSAVAGGATRFHSVKNALDSLRGLSPDDLVLVHDGVRPLLSASLIRRVKNGAEYNRAVVPVVAMVNTIRRKQGMGTVACDRDDFVEVQTPQGFRYGILEEAYRQEYRSDFTDDASVAEAAGARIGTVEGERNNLKITCRTDLAMAEAILDMR